MTRTGRPKAPPRTPFEIKLRKLMDDAGVKNYTSLANNSGVHESTIHRICGNSNPTIGTLKKLAAALNTTIDELV